MSKKTLLFIEDNLKVPDSAKNTYKYSYDAILKRKLAFESFLDNNVNEFTKNLNESYTYD
jgi:hypothetical protein